ncbi:hypothetical protein J6590_076660 [Homalodisca vitripennis]|nr:hypothetical protein J6590_076660 [Homalodisca vitripennis]
MAVMPQSGQPRQQGLRRRGRTTDNRGSKQSKLKRLGQVVARIVEAVCHDNLINCDLNRDYGPIRMSCKHRIRLSCGTS